MNVNTQSKFIRINGIDVFYGILPSGLIKNFKGIVYHFQTTQAFDTETHENAVKPIIDMLLDQSHDHGVSWELKRCEAVLWTEQSQVTVVSFRFRDSY